VNTIRILGTVLAGLLGLAFGSFLNVCLSRWPEGESVVKPRSHCRNCGRTLAWWENIPVASWLALRARCRTCKTKISWRYPLVELSVGVLWAYLFWQLAPTFLDVTLPQPTVLGRFASLLLEFALGWILIALAYLDVENLWLPNMLTFPGIALGLAFSVANDSQQRPWDYVAHFSWSSAGIVLLFAAISAAVSAGLILVVRWTYWLIRRREGIGLGDAKLMAMLGAWLGFSGALLSFVIGVMLGGIFALNLLATPNLKRSPGEWPLSRLPLGSFLCIGGIVTALWGQPIISAYLRWAGL
jgi:leader peptidase (prepilin peptidase) / N-methyltransferase